MIKPSINEFKKLLWETLELKLGKILDQDLNEYPGIQIGLEIDPSLEYKGVVALIRSVENNDRSFGLNNIRNRGNIEVHFTRFSGSEKVLKEIWDIIEDNFKYVSHMLIDSNEQYGQTGKLVVYFQFDYRV